MHPPNPEMPVHILSPDRPTVTRSRFRERGVMSVYFAANTPAPTPARTMDSKIFTPSVQPSAGSLARSGCGIIPNTLRPGLQIPAMLSSDPFGLVSLVISPDGSQ